MTNADKQRPDTPERWRIRPLFLYNQLIRYRYMLNLYCENNEKESAYLCKTQKCKRRIDSGS